MADPFGWIYGLYCPLTGALRYIGQTSTSLSHRLASHVCPSSYNRKLHSARWIRSLLRQGIFPEIRTLDIALSQGDLDEKEVLWISRCRSEGHHLTNIANGGFGGTISTEAILRYLSDGHSKVEAASYFGKSPTFIHRRLKAIQS